MQLAQFIDTHAPALEQDEVRHGLMLGVLARAAKDPGAELATWTLGAPGACAIKSPGRPILLGVVSRQHCRALVEATRGLDYIGVAGTELAPQWFVERAVELGDAFPDPLALRIHALREAPAYPGAGGHARQVAADDGPLLADWLLAFSAEAVPEDPVPSRAEFEKVAGEGRHLFWVVDGEPVSLAGIVRRTRNTGTIAAVYTPPALRGRGYAGSVTAAVAERIFAEGKSVVSLYTDLANSASNRCYAKIGFKPACDAWVYRRLAP